jgi:hypothetical protein
VDDFTFNMTTIFILGFVEYSGASLLVGVTGLRDRCVGIGATNCVGAQGHQHFICGKSL